MAQNLANLNPQQLQQLQIQAIQQQLQAPNEFGTNKLLVNVNGQNSKLPTNKNGIIKYTLEQPIKLEIGDKITLIESFVEERGLAVDTISFEEDIEEEIRFLYYIQGDCRNTLNVNGAAPYSKAIACDQEFTSFPNVQPDCYSSNDNVTIGIAGQPTFFGGLADFEPYMYPNRNYAPQAPATNTSAVGSAVNVTVGANGQYYYLCEYFSPQGPQDDEDNTNSFRWNEYQETDSKRFTFISQGQSTLASYMRPLYGATTIKIPAGNYSVSALSDLINNQLNGTAIPDNPTRDKLTNKFFHNDNNIQAQQTVPAFQQLNQKSDYRDTLPRNVYNPDVDIIGEDTHQCYDRRRGDVVTQMFFNYAQTSSRINMEVMRGVVRTSDAAASPIPNWADGTTGMNSDPNGKANVLNTCYDPILFDKDVSPARVAFRSNATNFYMHLDGFKHLFGKDVAPSKTYWNKDYSINGDDMAKGLWNIKYMPSLFDQFSGNLGLKGKFYFGDDVHDYNSERYSAADGFTSKPFYFSEQSAGIDPATGNPIENVEAYKFMYMYPVKSSADDNNPAAPQDDTANEPINVGILQQFAGTTAFNLDYDSGASNRFTISNLHEPYKMASRTPDNKSSTNVGGQQATIFNTPVILNKNDGGSITPFPNLKCGIYPIDSAGGISVNNFSFSTVKSTKVYKDLVNNISILNTSNTDHQFAREAAIFELFTKPYDEFFETEAQAKEAWATTLWSRIGFTYDQLGNVSNNLETIYTFSNSKTYESPANPRFVKQMGIITHNAFDYTFIPSSSGLGSGNPAASVAASENPQNYGLRGYTAGSNFNFLQSDIVYGFAQNYINILSDSKAIIAEAFPSLNNGNNYLVIESDIVKTNAKDSNSNSTTIVGIMSKENATNDTIFSVNPITFINTEQRLLATIEVKIKNPDGTLVSDDVVGKNNGFVFQIEKAIKMADVSLQSI